MTNGGILNLYRTTTGTPNPDNFTNTINNLTNWGSVILLSRAGAQQNDAWFLSQPVTFLGACSIQYTLATSGKLTVSFLGGIQGSGSIASTFINPSGSGGYGQVNLYGNNSGYSGSLLFTNAGNSYGSGGLLLYDPSGWGTGNLNYTRTSGKGPDVIFETNVTSTTSSMILNGATALNNGGYVVTLGSLAGTATATNDIGSGGTLNVGADGTSTTFAGVVTDTGNLNKIGAGTLTLSGANTYSGATTVSNGVLNTTTASTGAGSYTVNDGTTLGVTLSGIGASLAMSGATFGNSGATILNLNLAGLGHTTAPLVNDTGSVTMNGNVTVNLTNAPNTPGTSVLFQYSGRSGPGSFVAGTLPSGPGVSVSLVDNTGSQQVQLVIVSTVASLEWGLASSGTWNTSSPNWQPLGGGSATTYSDGDFATFNDDPGSGPITVTLAATRTPASVTVEQ